MWTVPRHQLVNKIKQWGGWILGGRCKLYLALHWQQWYWTQCQRPHPSGWAARRILSLSGNYIRKKPEREGKRLAQQNKWSRTSMQSRHGLTGMKLYQKKRRYRLNSCLRTPWPPKPAQSIKQTEHSRWEIMYVCNARTYMRKYKY